MEQFDGAMWQSPSSRMNMINLLAYHQTQEPIVPSHNRHKGLGLDNRARLV